MAQVRKNYLPKNILVARSFAKKERSMQGPILNMAIPIDVQEIFWQELIVDKFIGGGAFGKVFSGKWKDVDVAIKRLVRDFFSDGQVQILRKEAYIMSKCRFPNVVQLYGVCLETGHYSLVMEYMSKGSLYDLLHQQIQLPWKRRIEIAFDIAKGLNYLHDLGILHRDLKSQNILLGDVAKISDFGVSKLKTETIGTQTQQAKGTLRWAAPELFQRNAINTAASDVYSYGMILWELASRKIPFEDCSNEQIVMGWIMNGTQENIPEDSPEDFQILIKRCWKINPAERANLSEIIMRLNSLMEAFKEKMPSVIDLPDDFPIEPKRNSQELPLYPLPLPVASAPPLSVPYLPAPSTPAIPLVEEPVKPKVDLKPPRPKVIPRMAFGREKWLKYFGDPGTEPPFDCDIEKLLDSPCPFWEGKRIRDTHILILIPKEVDGKPFSTKMLAALGAKLGNSCKFKSYPTQVDFQNQKSRWALITREVIPDSRGNHVFAALQSRVSSFLPYDISSVIEISLGVFAEYLHQGRYIFSHKPSTYARCKEKFDEKRNFAVGNFSDNGLEIDNDESFFPFGWNRFGVAAVRTVPSLPLLSDVCKDTERDYKLYAHNTMLQKILFSQYMDSGVTEMTQSSAYKLMKPKIDAFVDKYEIHESLSYSKVRDLLDKFIKNHAGNDVNKAFDFFISDNFFKDFSAFVEKAPSSEKLGYHILYSIYSGQKPTKYNSQNLFPQLIEKGVGAYEACYTIITKERYNEEGYLELADLMEPGMNAILPKGETMSRRDLYLKAIECYEWNWRSYQGLASTMEPGSTIELRDKKTYTKEEIQRIFTKEWTIRKTTS